MGKMEITVRDILGSDFFCDCDEPEEEWQGRVRKSPFLGFPDRAVFLPRCAKCGKQFERRLKHMNEYIPDSIYEHPPVNGKLVDRCRFRPGDGTNGKGKPRAWDSYVRPVELDIFRYYGFPHHWPILAEAENPYLEEDEKGLMWIHEYDDAVNKGKRWRGEQFDSFHEAFEAAKKAYVEMFDDGNHVLIFSGVVKSTMPHYEFKGRREGD